MLLRHTLRRLASSAGGFSSAAFTGEDGGIYESARRERQRLRRDHHGQEQQQQHGVRAAPELGRADSTRDSVGATPGSSTDQPSSTSSSSFPTSGEPSSTEHREPGRDDASTGAGATAAAGTLERPTIDTYRAMSDEALAETLRTRDQQIQKLRAIYENFHYDADKHFRKMIFDYHDKTMQLSQVHGRMQQASLQINREALSKMRDEQDMMTRDKRMIFILCALWSVVFWVWVRRHYVLRRELEQESLSGLDRAAMNPSVTGAGSYNDNFLGLTSRNARFRETTWEKEVRERREAQAAQEQQRTLLCHQAEVQKAVASRQQQQQ